MTYCFNVWHIFRALSTRNIKVRAKQAYLSITNC